MLIDWFTVGAQAVNFLILVWLLHRFLYKPVLDAIEAREQRIAAELADAAKKQAEGLRQRDEYQHKSDEFDRQREALLNQARDEANSERQRLLDEARQAAVALSTRRQEALNREERDLHLSIVRRMQQEVFDISRKVLADLAGTSLEERLVEVFVQRLHTPNGEAKRGLEAQPADSPEPATVRTTGELSPAQRAATEAAIQAALGPGIQIQYETVPQLISGIELTMNGRKLCWSIADYLASLDQGVDQLSRPAQSSGASVEAQHESTPAKSAHA